MKAMIFAAGLGTRLRPLTDNRPKALVEVAGKPMLLWVVESLKRHGFDDITINVHHFAGQIIDFARANGDFGVTLHISHERDLLLDTGGGILHARQWLDGDEPFLVHNTDIITDANLLEIYRHHTATGADATLLTAPRATTRYLLFDGSGRLNGWVNKSTGKTLPEGLEHTSEQFTELAFGGIHVISPRVFPALEAYATSPSFPIIPFYVALCRQLRIMSYVPQRPCRWHDIGKIDSLAQAAQSLAQMSQAQGRQNETVTKSTNK